MRIAALALALAAFSPVAWADPGLTLPRAATAARNSAVLDRNFDRDGDLRENVLLHTRIDRAGGDRPVLLATPVPAKRLASKGAVLARAVDREGDERQFRLATLTLSRRHATLARLRDFGGDADEYALWRMDYLWHGPSRANARMADPIVHQAINEGLQRHADEAQDQRADEEEEQRAARDEARDDWDLEREIADREDRSQDREDEKVDEAALEDMEGDERAEERELERAEETEAERTIQAEEDGSIPE